MDFVRGIISTVDAIVDTCNVVSDTVSEHREAAIIVAATAATVATGGLALAFAPAIGAVVSVAGFGVAGGTLSGAAASSAGLAALGGGSLASGGLGMAGGTAAVTAVGGLAGGAVAGGAANALLTTASGPIAKPTKTPATPNLAGRTILKHKGSKQNRINVALTPRMRQEMHS